MFKVYSLACADSQNSSYDSLCMLLIQVSILFCLLVVPGGKMLTAHTRPLNVSVHLAQVRNLRERLEEEHQVTMLLAWSLHMMFTSN